MTKTESIEEASIPENNGFSPLAVLKNTIHFWWFVFILIVAGGLAGWLAHRANPPVYEAVAQFSSSIDYVSTGPLTQLEEDTAIDIVGNVVSSQEILQAVVNQAAKEGIPITLAEFRKAIVLERRVNVWDLRVRSADPRAAERLANLWVEQGRAVLLDSYQHALQADILNRYLLSLENCLSQTAASEPASAQCSRARFSEIQDDLSQAGKAYYQERLASRGLFSGLTIGPIEPAAMPDRPVLFNRNQVVLAGCLIGLLLGIWLVELGIPARWMRRD